MSNSSVVIISELEFFFVKLWEDTTVLSVFVA